MKHLTVNRRFFLPDVIGKKLKVNDQDIDWLHIPNRTSLEKNQGVSLDLIIIGFRDCFGDRQVPVKPDGTLIFDLPISGYDTQCSAEYETVDNTMVIINVVKV